MAGIKKENRKRRQKKYVRRHKRSMFLISMVIVMLVIVVSVSGYSLNAKNKQYLAQETELQAKIDAEKKRSQEVDELGDYVGTDGYIEAVAKEKLGLVYENETLFKSAN